MLWRHGAVPPIEERLQVIARFADDMRELGPANFLYTDGDALFAHGHRRLQADGQISPPGLWLLQRKCTNDADWLAQAGVVIDDGSRGQEILLIASVPLTGEAWVPFEEGAIIVVRDGATLTQPHSPISASL